MTRKEALDKIKSILHKVAPKAKVILYGSEARGEASPDSDFDLLILEDVDYIGYDRMMEITSPLYDMSWQDGIEVSPMVLTKKQWETRPFVTPFYCNVINEGIVL